MNSEGNFLSGKSQLPEATYYMHPFMGRFGKSKIKGWRAGVERRGVLTTSGSISGMKLYCILIVVVVT